MASVHRLPGSKRWYASFTLPDGRRTFRKTGTTNRSKALLIAAHYERASRTAREGRLTEAAAREVIADIFAIGNQEAMPNATLKDFLLKTWLPKKELELAEASYPEYRKVAENLLGQMGRRADRPMDAFTVRDATEFRAHMAGKLAPASVNKYLKILRNAWNDATKHGYVRENIFAKVEGIRIRVESARRPFTLDELRRLMAACDGEWRGLVMMGLYTGQRLSDCRNLEWRNVDLPQREIRLVTQKTGRVMAIPMADPLYEYFLALEAPDDPDSAVFPEASGAAQQTLSRQFVELLATIGLAERRRHRKAAEGRDRKRVVHPLSFHSLRHTATSLLKNAGVSDVVAREIIGHDSAAVSRVYTHIERDALRSAVDRLPDVTRP